MHSDRIPSLGDLVLGTRICVPYDQYDGLSDYSWKNKFEVGTVVSSPDNGFIVVMMDKKGLLGAKSFAKSTYAQDYANRSYITGIRNEDRVFFTVEYARAVRFYDPAFIANSTAFGNFTCSCGFANKDVSTSSIVNGKYVCYQCRVIGPRHRAA